MQRDIKFDWHRFTTKDLTRLNTDRTLDIYGYVLIDTDAGRYIADIQWETIRDYGRRGISINLYESDDDWYHNLWLTDLKSIITATDYKRFQKRAEAVIRKYLEEVQEKNTLISEAKKGIKFFAQGYGEGPDRF